MDETDCGFDHAEDDWDAFVPEEGKAALRDNLGNGYTIDTLVAVIDQMGL